ncbi:D-inositol-3-phosphate glycosyltransferase [Komagataeibacter europaeus]|uniref:D-inositol-3-phosphate glycosyltransferase n=1 Tax=Komagataeibacter europaeus TaxID=33995 RepID=A0A0M0EH09_KOMEU|nr:glycosyltransferase family 1 protein [Komagataeibacter europaeus]KON64236.1 D-inositol-3-phosphate glycosyltransferase [Komagataeibacter europaeus]
MRILPAGPKEDCSEAALSFPTIWLDSRNIGRAGGTGVATYACGLQECLESIGFHTEFLWDHAPDQPEMGTGGIIRRIVRFLRALVPVCRIDIGGQGPASGRYPFVPDLYRIAHIHFRTCRRLLHLRSQKPPAIMFWTYPLAVTVENTINIVTIHDIIPLTHPELTGICPDILRSLLLQLVARADFIVTVTETVRQQVMEKLGVPADKVVNLYQLAGVSQHERQQFRHASQVAPRDCFVCIGRVEKRKNIERLVEAHARSGTRRPLVLLGPDGDDMPDFTPRAPQQQIIRVPWCNRLSLLRTLADAHALLFPSLAEGFGLPIIEAMSLGVPVLTSRGGATEEVAGQAAILVDAYEIEDITRGIVLLDRMQPGMPAWEELCVAGLQRAKKFAPPKQIARLEAFYEYLCSRFPNLLLPS